MIEVLKKKKAEENWGTGCHFII